MKSKRKLKANLVSAGIRQREIAKKAGVSPSAVCKVLSGKLHSKKVESAIAESLKRPGKAAA